MEATRTPKASLSICHWILNSVSAHNYVKMSLLKAYIAFHKLDIMSLSESVFLVFHLMITPWKYLGNNNLVRSDHLFNSRNMDII